MTDDLAVSMAAAADLMSDNRIDIALMPIDLSDSETDSNTTAVQKTLWKSTPELPVENPKHDKFLMLYAQGSSAGVAYMMAVSDDISKKSATEQASRLLRRADYCERLAYLRRQRIVELKRDEARKNGEAPGRRTAAAPAEGAGEAAGGEKAAGGAMTREDVVRQLEAIVETTPNENTRMAAIDKLAKLKGWVKDESDSRKEIPDPAYLAAFLRRAQALKADPVALAKEEKIG